MTRQSTFPEARAAGHLIGAAAGVASFGGGAMALMHDMPPVLGVTMLIIGAALAVLALFSFQNYSRMAWSFLNAIMVVMGLVTLFGAPKVRSILGIPLGAALIIPVVLVLGVVALSLVAQDYRGTLSQKSQNAPR